MRGEGAFPESGDRAADIEMFYRDSSEGRDLMDLMESSYCRTIFDIYGAERESERSEALEEYRDLQEEARSAVSMDWCEIRDLSTCEMFDAYFILSKARRITRELWEGMVDTYNRYSGNGGVEGVPYSISEATPPREGRTMNLMSKDPRINKMVELAGLDGYRDYENSRFNFQKEIIRNVENDPRNVSEVLQAVPPSSSPFIDCYRDSFVDRLFGINEEEINEKVDVMGLSKKYGLEQSIYQGTPYYLAKDLVEFWNLGGDDTVYDMGSGIGRVVLTGSLLTDAFWKGVELSPVRVRACDEAIGRVGIGNAEIIQDNVKSVNFSDGDMFYLFDPFVPDTMVSVKSRLKDLADEKDIHIVSLGRSTPYFEGEDWLEEVHSIDTGFPTSTYGLTFFKSV